MDKQKLEEEKMKMVWQLNVLNEQIDSYNIPDIACDSGMFRDIANRKYAVELRIKELNFLISQCK